MSKHYIPSKRKHAVCMQTTITAKNKISDMCQKKPVRKHDRNSVDT